MNDENSFTRKWQRFTNAKWIQFGITRRFTVKNDLLLKKVSMLKNVERVSGWCQKTSHISILKTIVKNNRLNIKRCEMGFNCSGDQYTIGQLKLPNAQFIRVNNSIVNIKWSKNCQMLRFYLFNKISYAWCNFIIEQCDCSGLHLRD